jgi:peroxiredoxin
MKKNIIILMMAVFLVALPAVLTAGEKEDSKKFRKFYEAGKFDKALAVVDKAIEKYPDYKERWLNRRYHILTDMKRYDEALEAALAKYNAAKKKSPGRCLDVARAYLKVNNKDNALKWIGEAVKLGYKKFYVFEKEDSDYRPLKGDPRLDAYIAKIKENIGFGKPPRDFTVTSLSGKELTLSKLKGKVVLVDFWATWCPPCVREMPNLKAIYKDYNARGFEIIGISVDSSKEKLGKFINKEKIKWPIAFSGKGWQDEIKESYKVTSIPSMWLVDKKGILRHFDVRGEKLRTAVTRLLAE